MQLDSTRDDISFLRRTTEEARFAPLIGGSIMALWGSIIACAYVGEAVILSGIISAPKQIFLVMWAALVSIGVFGQILLSRGLDHKPGARSIGNQVNHWVWRGVCAGIACFAAGALLATGVLGASPLMFDMIVGVAFAGYGAAFLVTGRISGVAWMQIPAGLSFFGAALTPVLAGSALLYWVSAVIVVCVAIVPGLLLQRAAQPPQRETK